MSLADEIIHEFGTDWNANSRLAKKLAELGRPAVGALVTALASKDGYVRCGAAEALGLIGDQGVVDALILALETVGNGQDEDFEARIKAAEALGRIGDRRAIPTLLKVLPETLATDGNIAPFVIDALAALKADEAVAALTGLRSHSNADVRASVGRALTAITSRADDRG